VGVLPVRKKGGGLGAVQTPAAPVTTEQPEHNRMAIPSFGNYLYLPLVFKGGGRSQGERVPGDCAVDTRGRRIHVRLPSFDRAGQSLTN
jgi:hypothetical protein